MKAKKKNKTPLFRTARQHLIPLVVGAAALIILLVGAAVTNGAFVGTGKAKGVLIQSDLNFNSDILTRVSGAADVATVPYHSIGAQPVVYIRNFSLSTHEVNYFDVEYTLYCWLSGTEADPNYTYSVLYPGLSEPIAITGGSDNMVSISGRTLSNGIMQEDTYAFSFNQINAGTEPSRNICVLAVPDAPDFMKGFALGRMLVKADAESSIRGDFDFEGATDLSDLGGFLYRILVSGSVSSDTRVTLKWDADKLSLDVGNELWMDRLDYTETEENANGEIWCYLTFVPRAVDIAFYRAAGFDARSLSDVQAYVEFPATLPNA